MTGPRELPLFPSGDHAIDAVERELAFGMGELLGDEVYDDQGDPGE